MSSHTRRIPITDNYQRFLSVPVPMTTNYNSRTSKPVLNFSLAYEHYVKYVADGLHFAAGGSESQQYSKMRLHFHGNLVRLFQHDFFHPRWSITWSITTVGSINICLHLHRNPTNSASIPTGCPSLPPHAAL